MAIRNIRENGDAVLRKKARIVEKIDERTLTLIEDMIDTMYDADGVGLAAPQVGILKRIVVIDVGDGPIVMINPEIISKAGSQTDIEACLSVPGASGEVERPFAVVCKSLDENGVERVIEAEELLARAICHEIDHLDGTLFIDKIQEIVG